MARQKKERPGVLLYFEWLPALSHLSDSQRGRLLFGALSYAHNGSEPKLDDDPVLAALWPLVAARVTSDGEKYNFRCQEASLARRYAYYKAAREKSGELALSYEEWRSRVIGEQES